MAHAVDEPGVIERFFIKQAGEVIADFILVRPVFDLLLHVTKHAYDLDVRAAVLWAF